MAKAAMIDTQSERLSLDPAYWPDVDRQLWIAARRHGHILDEAGAAARWHPKTARQVEKGYCLWLGYLARTGQMDTDTPPAARVTREALRGHVEELQARVAPVTVTSRIRDLREALRVMQPEADLWFLTQVLRRLEARATPRRDKAARVVPSAALFEAGFTAMRHAVETPAPSEHIRAARFRNGLIIAFLAACPVRRANLAMMAIGTHLITTDSGYLCRWGAGETKEGRPREFALPDELVSWMDLYLALYRPMLLGTNISDRLWISVRRTPMSEQGIYGQVTQTTAQFVGHPVNPHLFRDCLATSISTELPDQVRMAAAILGHATLETTRRYYDHAKMLEAVRRSNAVITRLRARFRQEDDTDD